MKLIQNVGDGFTNIGGNFSEAQVVTKMKAITITLASEQGASKNYQFSSEGGGKFVEALQPVHKASLN